MEFVVLVLMTLGAALVVGYARGGRLRRLLEVRPRRGRLLYTALGIAVLGVLLGWIWPWVTTVSWAATLLTTAWYFGLNRVIHGAGLVAVGAAVNAGTELAVLVADPPRFALLDDVIPVALPWTVERVGVGDVAVAAGLATILATSMLGANTPTMLTAAEDERLDAAGTPPDHQQEEETHGEARPQAQGPEEERSEPREAPQQLTCHGLRLS